MTATILLVRHAAHAHLGRVLSGRAGEVALSEQGIQQARQLADWLGREPLDRVQTSPVKRARDTARTIAQAKNTTVELVGALDEVDFGDWAGQGFAELERDPRWHAWNVRRSKAQAPGGETMVAVQQRVLLHLRQLARSAPGMVVAMISHADVIRAAVAGVLGLSLDRLLSFDVDPASVTRIAAGTWGERLLSLNERAA